MRSNKYWQERFLALEEAQLIKGEEYYRELEKEYIRAKNEIESKIARWYGRIADNNEISIAQAKKWLKDDELEEFRWTVEEYIQYGKENALNKLWIKQLENASAKVHITRLEALKIQLQQTIEVLCTKQTKGLSDTLSKIYEEGYYHTAFEIQKGFNIGWSIPSLDARRVKQIISKPWAIDGANFSTRIWGDAATGIIGSKQQLVNVLYKELTQDIILGKAPDKTIGKIAKKFETSKVRAGRLVMTESAFFASASQKDCFKDLGVEEYQIVATLDNYTSEICRELDGKIFKITEYEPGLTAPPFHCWCRTTTIPNFEDNFGERIARDESGRQYYIPDNITYKEWKKEYVKTETVNKELEKLQKLKPPNKSRHLLTSIGKNSKPKETNTIIMPDVDYLSDIECIQKGLYNKINGMYAVENRIYTYHDNVFYPVFGEGFITLNRNEYKWLQKIKVERNNPKLNEFLHGMGATDNDIKKITEILKKGGIL